MIFNELTILKKNLVSSIYSRYVNYSLSFLLFLFVFSCSGGEDSSVENTFETNVQNQNNGQTNPTTPTPVEEIEIQTLDKKGIGMSYRQRTWSTRIGGLKPFWSYSWNKDYREAIPEGVEYVPMFWGAASVTDAEINRIKGLVNSGIVKNVLGFNEPDLPSQANMTVAQAIELWPKLEEIGVPLGSPVPSTVNSVWLQEFMSEAESKNLRVDFICIHIYRGNDSSLFFKAVDDLYEKYRKPIWVTEMSIVDNDAKSISENKITHAMALPTMKSILSGFYQRSFVKRFAWFSGTKNSPNYPRLVSSILYDENDNLTILGNYYSQFRFNPKSGPGSLPEVIEEIEGNVIKNGTFETGDVSPWGGFKNAVISSATQKPNTGGYLARIEPHDGSIYQIINLEPGEKYELKFFHRWKDTPVNTFKAAIRNEQGNESKFLEYEIPKTDQWSENKIEFTVPSEVTTARLVFYKPQLNPLLPTFFLDDVSITKL